MINDEKTRLLEIGLEEGAITLDYGLEVYSSKSSVSRALGSLEKNGFLIQKKPPKISRYQKVWVLTDKGRKFLEIDQQGDEKVV